MALLNYSPSTISFYLNGREITNWGKSETCVSFENIENVSDLIICQGGGSYRSDRINQGKKVMLYLQRGTADAAFIQGLLNTRANINVSYRIIGTTEVLAGYNGVINNNGTTETGAGDANSDKIFEISLTKSIES